MKNRHEKRRALSRRARLGSTAITSILAFIQEKIGEHKGEKKKKKVPGKKGKKRRMKHRQSKGKNRYRDVDRAGKKLARIGEIAGREGIWVKGRSSAKG